MIVHICLNFNCVILETAFEHCRDLTFEILRVYLICLYSCLFTLCSVITLKTKRIKIAVFFFAFHNELYTIYSNFSSACHLHGSQHSGKGMRPSHYSVSPKTSLSSLLLEHTRSGMLSCSYYWKTSATYRINGLGKYFGCAH